MTSQSNLSLSTPPSFCQYATGPCDQNFDLEGTTHAAFLYPSEPKVIANTIEEAVKQLQTVDGNREWVSWKNLSNLGQIIFCRICKALRFTDLVVADVTTLNFNLLFEIGYAVGLGKSVLPIRDATYQIDKKSFAELGLLDTLGYLDFQNSQTLVDKILKHTGQPTFAQPPQINRQQPIYFVKAHIENEGQIRLMSSLKKYGWGFRSFDPSETPRLTLHEAFKQVLSSYGAVLHLLSPSRTGAVVHNARCAFVAGLAMATNKRVLMVQEGESAQPIDYRDVVVSYTDSNRLPDLLLPFVRGIAEAFQDAYVVVTSTQKRPLEKLDLGDIAAENEIRALSHYFVKTAEFQEAKRGHAHLVVGRKGGGKTAIFYGLWNSYKGSRSQLLLDLKPEGYQFGKLKEFVVKELSPASQEHVLTAFWNFLLLMELAHKVVHEENRPFMDTTLREAYEKIATVHGRTHETEQGDFSERLFALIDDVMQRKGSMPDPLSTAQITQLVYSEDIHELSNALSDYLSKSGKETVWLLFDNLDKGWPVQAASQEDILLLKTLLDAARKLQRQMRQRDIEFRAIVFVRNDIYQHLVLRTADRGKDSAVLLDWNDPEVFKEILKRRIVQSTGTDKSFDELWLQFFEPQVGGEQSFTYVLRHTLMRPREVIRLIRDCVNVAVNRGHDTVTESDFISAQSSNSEEAFMDISLELGDVNPRFADIPYIFIGAKPRLSRSEVMSKLLQISVNVKEQDEILDLLLWFGFLGVIVLPDQERYSYEYRHDLRRMKSGLPEVFGYSIHPSFRSALGCVDS
jgi:hypothetical protein